MEQVDGHTELITRIDEILQAFHILVDYVGNCCDCFASGASVEVKWAKEIYEREMGQPPRTRRKY